MRGFLIFLAFAFPVALTSPFFWSLVNMEFGAERVGYVQQSGVTQWAWLGPRSPWPVWAPKPEGADFTVRSHFEAAPGMMAMGMGDVDIDKAAPAATADYAAQLVQAGWTVKRYTFDTIAPELPPRPMRWCLVQAQKSTHSLTLRLEGTTANTSNGVLHWAEGPLPPLMGAVEGAC